MVIIGLLQLEPPQCFGFRLSNPWGFFICVGMRIVWMEIARSLLFLFVCLHLLRIGAQVVSESEVPRYVR